MHVLHTILRTFPTHKENLSNNQELLKFAIISFFLMALRFDSGAILLGETRCLSHSGHKGLITFDHVTSAFCCWALSISLAMRSSVRLLDITLTFFCNSYCKIM